MVKLSKSMRQAYRGIDICTKGKFLWLQAIWRR